MRQTTVEEREIVIQHFNNNKSYRDIGKMWNRSASSIRCETENRLRNKIKINPKNKLTEADERWLPRNVEKDKKLSAWAFAIDVELYLEKSASMETVTRYLRRSKYNCVMKHLLMMYWWQFSDKIL